MAVRLGVVGKIEIPLGVVGTTEFPLGIVVKIGDLKMFLEQYEIHL